MSVINVLFQQVYFTPKKTSNNWNMSVTLSEIPPITPEDMVLLCGHILITFNDMFICMLS